MRLEVFSLFSFNPENIPRLWLLFGQKDETKEQKCCDDVLEPAQWGLWARLSGSRRRGCLSVVLAAFRDS